MKTLLIHIGYHKTASTWLQRDFFRNDNFGFYSPWKREKIATDFILPDGLTFNENQIRSTYEEDIDKALAFDKVPVISHERLAGYPASGGYDCKKLADHLHAVFPKAKILIVIRRQRDILKSWYKEYIYDGGALSYKVFFNSIGPKHIVRVPHFRYIYYEYDRLISYYQSLFSKDNILVLPYELLRIDPSDFSKQICNFTGVRYIEKKFVKKQNVGKRLVEMDFLRFLNRIFYFNQLNPYALFSMPTFRNRLYKIIAMVVPKIPESVCSYREKEIEKFIDVAVAGRYTQSNKDTSRITGINLQSFGYN